MKTVDQVLGWLLVAGAVLHAGGSWAGYRQSPELLVWALSGSLAAILVAALNLLRINRPRDRTLALVSVAASAAWVVVALAFGAAIGNVFDPRAVIHAINAAALAAMGIRTVAQARTGAHS